MNSKAVKVPVSFEGRTIAQAEVADGVITFRVKDSFILDEFLMFGFTIADYVPVREGSAAERQHQLLGGGAPFDSKGNVKHEAEGFGKCSCGALSEKAYPTPYRRQKWHKSHVLLEAQKSKDQEAS